jgi:hypothetical protein
VAVAEVVGASSHFLSAIIMIMAPQSLEDLKAVLQEDVKVKVAGTQVLHNANVTLF